MGIDNPAGKVVNGFPDPFSKLSSVTLENYLTLVNDLKRKLSGRNLPCLIGVSGAQGTGKSTLCEFLKQQLESRFNLRSVVLSLDDFYLTQRERRQLAEGVHPLLATRGVPGTHDLNLLDDILNKLIFGNAEDNIAVPVFDKLADDRLAETEWRNCFGRPGLVILEGWCVGAKPESSLDLDLAINLLEEEKDSGSKWRIWVNQQLKDDYRALFKRLDGLVFLRAPSIDCAGLDLPDMEQIAQWRAEQEVGLSQRESQGCMEPAAVKAFVMYYERITRTMQREMPDSADVVLTLNRRHEVIAIKGGV